jgi:hypothetical protein
MINVTRAYPSVLTTAMFVLPRQIYKHIPKYGMFTTSRVAYTFSQNKIFQLEVLAIMLKWNRIRGHTVEAKVVLVYMK